jgi:hypothetical protein
LVLSSKRIFAFPSHQSYEGNKAHVEDFCNGIYGFIFIALRFELHHSTRILVLNLPSSRISHRVALARTEVSEEYIAFIIRMTRIGELGK